MIIKKHLSSGSVIDPTGGTFNAGFIGGISLITKGDAQGHDLYIDDEFLDQVVVACSLKPLRCKFMHSSLFTDSIGSFLGKVINVRREGDQVLGDLSFAESSTKTRYGNLADYILTMARETPDALGASIEFGLDIDAMQLYIESNGGIVRVDESGKLHIAKFTSFDDNNKNNYPHARLSDVSAVALVDEPAANPNGLFAKFSEIGNEVKLIANLIKNEIEGKQNLGILKELSLMSINLTTEVKPEETTPVVETVVEQTALSTEVVQETLTVEVTEPVLETPTEVPSAEKVEIAELKAMLNELKVEFSKQKDLINFSQGAVPVAPVVEVVQAKTEGYREKFQKSLKQKH